MRTGKSHLIGLVLPDVRLPYFGGMTQLLSELSAQAGYQLLVASTNWDLSQEQSQIEALADRRVDGIILMSVNPLQDFEKLVSSKLRLIVVDRPEVAVKSAQVVTQHLIEHGHREIAVVAQRLDVVATRRRMTGWQQAMDAAELDRPPHFQYQVSADRAGGYEAGIRLLSSPTRPTGVYVEFDAQAVGLLRAAHERGVRVPQDLAVVTTDGTEFATFAIPSLTTVEVPTQAIAAQSLEAVIDGAESGVRVVTNQDFALVRRESCGCQPA
jgi:LacI family transcriptional regulator